MKTTNLGFPRIGNKRELKKAVEGYWKGSISEEQLKSTAQEIRKINWSLQDDNQIDLIPSNDFSLYDQVLDLAFTVGAIPERFKTLQQQGNLSDIDLYFAMARGYQQKGLDIKAMSMKKWFDTNYHYIVPEFTKNQDFSLFSSKVIDEFKEALSLGIKTKPVLIGPVTFLLLGKAKEDNFDCLELLDKLLPIYAKLLKELKKLGAENVQFDEPCLALDSTPSIRNKITAAYNYFANEVPSLKIFLANYFDCYGDNLATVLQLPIHTLHLDITRCGEQINDIFTADNFLSTLHFSIGIIDGRNIWKNDYQKSLTTLSKVIEKVGKERILIAPSCSLLHVPCDLNLETETSKINQKILPWLSFAKQKLGELSALKQLVLSDNFEKEEDYIINQKALQTRNQSTVVHQPKVKERVQKLTAKDAQRSHLFKTRKILQKEALNLPLYPTTTIGSFPQTKEVRQWRAAFKNGRLSAEEYQSKLEEETKRTISLQEEIGLDVLVHGEFERNDMVEYFGEQLEGFTFSSFGWVQSYGSRCVKPPIIFGDVSRSNPMTVAWTKYAQSCTDKYIKGMLTGPVTILQWSFVRDDQPRSETCTQIALAIRDEVQDLESAGIKIIQIDEPAIREGLPLRAVDWATYLQWAVNAFKVSSSGVKDETQIHTHMCYSEFNDIIKSIADLDADVITIECSRSQMDLLNAFASFNYPNDIGPGIYDIHSPRVPSKYEMVDLIDKAKRHIPAEQLWVNPDCGLKTRDWPETKKALEKMVEAAVTARKLFTVLA
ncbi:5-methyltetrahydropteroyltriglutamate--homocysteine S-methyltransferase [Flammeovirga kamogawensis]|uniref:5-methyltetrahydropteroyltriglutamate--homocysteine methyltransferase n=1 Tax=Flammeovirga kamogawensis TaxID=373891 RepID=A0ABX8GU26_9BACT|nr:5-methyltetrahydropteroyltriglutamate--homocysteine S-methyltransferase [Flammeovirga kamogawensis]MBB6460050.1 5-methyltetrahydropteroyltriglutamate--homocysteine methyltransferase [Flammeovirga kamogawensis]QWG06903.1 5-methyltetrahydropteroyltriglutamate--homocysteine S-methyltransferase [Flammeovirga kamogawensis]TRX68724.1 5-methyltetrahydropteroyltriglutamate--homocysteine S-methyltransferase [Flammeovirga kamogawensis]